MEDRMNKVKQEEKKKKGTVNNCPFRMKYHIMPPVGWLNDPNGLCQFKGRYHAYFQYSPLNVHGGGGYWGHCISKDLLNWEYQEPVLTTDIPEDQSGVYSGSALVEKDRMYLFYTGNVKLPGEYDYIDNGRISSQILVESSDGQHMSEKTKILGMEDYPKDITAHVRDPKVWKEDGEYHMVLGARKRAWDEEGRRRDEGCALIYTSKDKKKWKFQQELIGKSPFGYMWECPDLFALKERKVLSFCPQGLESEKERFQNIYQSGYTLLDKGDDLEENFKEWDMGFDFYAPQSFQTEDGRRILIGWAGLPDTEDIHKNLSVENGWQHCLTIPAELTLSGDKILRMPVRELYDLNWKKAKEADGEYLWEDQVVKLQIEEIKGNELEILLGTEENGLTIHTEGNRIELSFFDKEGMPAKCGGGRKIRYGRTLEPVKKLLVLIDSSIVEVFANDGETVFTTRIYLDKKDRKLKIKGAGTKDCQVL